VNFFHPDTQDKRVMGIDARLVDQGGQYRKWDFNEIVVRFHKVVRLGMGP
jgi:hypothetical protein